jgi:hypothetical protein
MARDSGVIEPRGWRRTTLVAAGVLAAAVAPATLLGREWFPVK